MNNDQFLDGVKAILNAQFSAFSPTVLEEKKFAGRGAYLTAEVPGLPCRPCDQRTCTPGDFRCLTWLTPEHVAAAAERALATAKGNLIS